MSKKGISAAEKRCLLQDYFHTSKTFHQARDLEKIAQKTLHMKPEVVLEVLEQLVDDGLVRKEKVGIQNLYWSFPSEAQRLRVSAVAAQKALLEAEQVKAVDLQHQFLKHQSERQETDDRRALLDNVKSKSAELTRLEQRLQELRQLDPSVLDAKLKIGLRAKKAANRWIENKECLETFCNQNGFINDVDFYTSFGIDRCDAIE